MPQRSKVADEAPALVDTMTSGADRRPTGRAD
jgi:hypothetical protein